MKFNQKVLGAVLAFVWLAGCTGTNSADNRVVAKTCPLMNISPLPRVIYSLYSRATPAHHLMVAMAVNPIN